MPAFCVYIPKELRQQMREHTDTNWSQVVRQAIAQKLGNPPMPPVAKSTGRKLAADPATVCAWRRDNKASARVTARKFKVAPSTVKRYAVLLKSIAEVPAPTTRCCSCGTTKNLHKDGWYGYRCNSEGCIPF